MMAFSSRRSIMLALAAVLALSATVGCHARPMLKGSESFHALVGERRLNKAKGSKYNPGQGGGKEGGGGGGGSTPAERCGVPTNPLPDSCDDAADYGCMTDDNVPVPGTYMCRMKGNCEYRTQCVVDYNDFYDSDKGVCGCCDENGDAIDCPEEDPCDTTNSAECDGGGGWFMCRAGGQATFPPSVSPTFDKLDPRINVVCVDKDDAATRALMGDRCGCCGGDCPSSTAVQVAGQLRLRVRGHEGARTNQWEKGDRRALNAEWDQDAREEWEHDEWDQEVPEELRHPPIHEEDAALEEPPSQLGSQVMEQIAALKREEWDQDEPWDLEDAPQVQEEAAVDEGEWNQDAQEEWDQQEEW